MSWAECSPCGLVFGSDVAFDAHRVGEHEFTLHEGLAMKPPREDGRRCLSLDEMAQSGFYLDQYGRWRTSGTRELQLERVAL